MSPPLSPHPSKLVSEECTTTTSRMAITTTDGSFQTLDTDIAHHHGSWDILRVFPSDQVPMPSAQEANLAVPSPDTATTRYPIQTKPTQNSATEYVVDASTAKQLRLRRGVALCSVPVNWWVTEMMFLNGVIKLRHPQLCNKCGLFERTHSIPRPQKFPRRRTHGSKAIRTPPAHSDMRTPPGSDFVNRHSKDSRSPPMPIATHLLHALDPISGEIFPQHMPWHSPDAPDSASARVNRSHPTADQPGMYHANGQLPSPALSGAIWI
jgi:hypothetical protein